MCRSARPIRTDTTHLCPASTRLPYPNFTNYYIDSDFHGYAHYNAMNVNLQHRARDLAVTAIYTWAQSKDDKSAAAGVGATGSGYQGFMDNHHPQLDYGLSDFDVNQRFVSSYIYNLPFGRGKKFASGINRAADEAVGGWQLSGITTFQAGFPFGIGATDVNGLNNTPSQRANLISGCDPHRGLSQPFQRINMSCFTQPGAGTYGNSPAQLPASARNQQLGYGSDKVVPDHRTCKLRSALRHLQHIQPSPVRGEYRRLRGQRSRRRVLHRQQPGDPARAGLITNAAPARIIQLSGKLTF